MSIHQLYLIGGHPNETITLIEDPSLTRCRLICEFRGKFVHADEPDFFEALCVIRRELEKKNCILFCYGASLNIFPSPEMRRTAVGKVAHKLEMGQPATGENLVNIFEDGYDVIPSTVDCQNQYVKQWLHSQGQ
jgi:hypothetical protein